MAHYTEADLNNFSKKRLVAMFLQQQEQLDRINDNMERLIEQIRIMNSYRFGRKTEKLSEISGDYNIEADKGATYGDLLCIAVLKRAREGDKEAAELVREFHLQDYK